MGWELPRDRRFELDGIPFVGKTDIHHLSIDVNNGIATLRWKSDSAYNIATVYLATTNKFASGDVDKYQTVARTLTKKEQCTVDLNKYPSATVFKFVVSTKNNCLTGWYVPDKK